MSQKPLVSIITPTLNYGHFLEKTIQSIISQDYDNIEHIVIDGLSTDNTIELLKKYEKEYNLRWISEKDKGPSYAFDKGLKIAKGEIIGWCCADDYYTEGAIKKITEVFINNPEIDLVFGACQEFDYKTQQFSVICRENPASFLNATFGDFISGKKQLFQPSLFYSRKIIEKSEPYNSEFKSNADHDWRFKMLKKGAKVFYIDEILAIIGQHEGRGSIKYAVKGIKESMMLLRIHGGKIPFSLRASYFRWKYPKIPNLIKKSFPKLFLKISKIIKKI